MASDSLDVPGLALVSRGADADTGQSPEPIPPDAGAPDEEPGAAGMAAPLLEPDASTPVDAGPAAEDSGAEPDASTPVAAGPEDSSPQGMSDTGPPTGPSPCPAGFVCRSTGGPDYTCTIPTAPLDAAWPRCRDDVWCDNAGLPDAQCNPAGFCIHVCG